MHHTTTTTGLTTDDDESNSRERWYHNLCALLCSLPFTPIRPTTPFITRHARTHARTALHCPP